MKKTIFYTTLLILFATILFAQEVKNDKKENKDKTQNSSKGIDSPQAVEGNVTFSDGTNQLLRITDEGTFGAIQFQDGVPSDVTNKLYNNGGTLNFNGTALGSGGATEINDLTDAIFDGESLFLGNGAGANDDAGASDGIKNFNLAVGKNSLNLNTTGKSNAVFGNGALLSTNGASYNTAVGISSMRYNNSGENNVAVGFQSNYYNQTGNNNTIIGYKAGYGSNGNSYSGNIFIGYNAGYNETGSDKLYIENSNSSTPLIYGDFLTDTLRVNGWLHTTRNLFVGKGNFSTELYGIVAGANNGITARSTATFGEDLVSSSYLATVIGRFNDDAYNNFQPGAWIETEPLFVIGNGTDDANRANAVTVLKNGNVGIGPSSPTASLEVDAVNGVVFYGATTGSIPKEGSGSRMMWYQGKSAFRAGTAGPNNAWDDVNIGSYSTALNYQTKASGAYSFATGYITEASGQRSTAMGSNTKASGLHSTAIGSSTEATGDYSTAIGRNVKASGNGTIFIGDNSSATINNAGNDNRFAARFANGYRFYTAADLSTGALMNAGDNSWSSISDSTKKENFLPVNGEEVLNKISKFNLRSWNYKGQDPKQHRHYGPMAQEFFNAFGHDGIGTIGNDTTIASADIDGINLIAIKALEKRTKEQNQIITNLNKRIEELEKQNKELAKLNSKYREENATYRKSNLELRNDIELIKQAITNIKKNQKEIRVTSK